MIKILIYLKKAKILTPIVEKKRMFFSFIYAVRCILRFAGCVKIIAYIVRAVIVILWKTCTLHAKSIVAVLSPIKTVFFIPITKNIRNRFGYENAGSG